MGREVIQHGPLAGVAERRSRELAERRARRLQEARKEHTAAMHCHVNGTRLGPRTIHEIRYRVGIAKHAQSWWVPVETRGRK